MPAVAAVLRAILTFIGPAVAKVFTDKVLSWVALKVLLVALFTVVVPIILNNFVYDIMEIVFNFAGGQAAGASSMTGSMSFTGFLAWLIEQFQLAQCLAVFVSALLLRLCLSMIPFVRL